MEQEVYNYKTQHDKSDQGSRAREWWKKKSTLEESKQKKTRRGCKGRVRAEKSVIIVITATLSAATDGIVRGPLKSGKHPNMCKKTNMKILLEKNAKIFKDGKRATDMISFARGCNR